MASCDGPALAAAAVLAGPTHEGQRLIAAARRHELAISPLWRVLAPPVDLPEPPGAGEPLADLVAWCARVLDRPRDGAALGAVIGAIREAYLGRGWAVATASVAAGTSADRMPPWHVLVDAVALRSRARFAVETADEVAAHAPDRALLAAAVAEPPGGDGFRGAPRRRPHGSDHAAADVVDGEASGTCAVCRIACGESDADVHGAGAADLAGDRGA